MSAGACRSTVCLTGFLILLLTVCGCNRIQTEEEAVAQYYKNNPSAKEKRLPVAKVAGRVSIDGQPPAEGLGLFIVLFDPDHLEKQAAVPRVFTQCDAQGNFAFTTYFTGDGVPYGKYVATLVELHRPKLRPGVVMSRGVQFFVGPDEFKNLYNDPEKNKNAPAFLLDVQTPGRTDYQFDLAVAGKDPVKTPGPYAVTLVETAMLFPGKR
jgi:hypothetical protein